MYNFTQKSKNKASLNLIACCLSLLWKQIKSITGFAVVMLFLLASANLNAQVGVPCIDGNSGEWDGLAVTGAPSFELKHDVFTGNQDDIFTAGKDFKSWGQVSPTPDYSNWTFSPMQAKSDIMNAAAVIYTGITGAPQCGADPPFNAYDPSHTYLFFAGDRESNNGTGYIGFWFLLNGSTAVEDGRDKYFSPDHFTNFGQSDGMGGTYNANNSIGDLLVLADFTGGGRNAAITVLKWVGPGNGTEGNNLSLVKVGTASQVGQNNGGPVPVPSNFIVPAGQTEYDTNEFYEGVIDLTPVFDLVNNPGIICSATWMLETRSSAEITADSKDFVGGSFNLPPVINVSDDEVCIGGSGSLTATVKQGNMVIANPVADGYTFVWSGPGSFTGQGTATITIDDAQLADAGNYSVMVTSPTGCPPANGDEVGTLTVNPLPIVTANNASLECTDTTKQLTGSPSGGTWSGAHVSASGLFDATGLAPADYTVTYTYTDANGCINSADAIVTVNIAPELTVSCPSAKVVDCSDDISGDFATWLGSFSSNGGGGNVVDSYSATMDGNPVAFESLTAPTNICGTVVIVTLQATDDCGQNVNCNSTFTVNPAPAPAFVETPGDTAIDCDAAPPTGTSLSYSSGGDNPCITGSVIGVISGSHDECGGSYTETWTYTDDCQRTITHSRT
ncbi:hypothetical protein ACGK9U_16035, partial [Mariniflexile sp. HNIBRBA6329]|uniref:hypothetical protein n=1 Tax=Mariniflexile sp. HNIBRBA6329 TaxID=3373088 RepID=UPI003746A48F